MDDKDTRRPLDELMMAMDVVDTLRHQEMLVERELHADDRDSKMIDRLREIYSSQGIDVPDHVLKEGVAALKEERFLYKPPRRSLSTLIARVYISRSKWAKSASIAVLSAALLWGGFQFFFVGAEERRVEQYRKELLKERNAVIEMAKVDEVKDRARQHYETGIAALRSEKLRGAESAVDRLKDIQKQLEVEYEIRILSRPGEYSALWRIPDLNPQARNYYVVVEAVAPDGRILTIPVQSEEDGKTRQVDRWALRVDQSVYERVSADKQDDGIIQNRRFGVKHRGYLEPEYLMPASGAAITSW